MKVLIFDIETNGLNPSVCRMRWFGAYSTHKKRHFVYDYQKTARILNVIDEHDVVVGFNIKNFDIPVLEKHGIKFKGKIIIDLYEICADGKGNKSRLKALGYKLPNFKLDTIAEHLELGNRKGSIDYKVFQKASWTAAEQTKIRRYLKQDVLITRQLFEWLDVKFGSLKKYLLQRDIDRYKHINTTSSSLAYLVLCRKAKIEPTYLQDHERDADGKPPKTDPCAGAHLIKPRWRMVRGNICTFDFTSAYPHALVQANLFSHSCNCCRTRYNGVYFNLQGSYCKKSIGKKERAMYQLFQERLAAKKRGEQDLQTAIKLCINSLYGASGNPVFKQLFNENTRSDCTRITRVLLRSAAAHMEKEGYRPLYGFTDSLHLLIPPHLTKEKAEKSLNKFMQTITKNFPFPKKTCTLPLEKEIRFIWYIADGKYLWVEGNKLKYKHTLIPYDSPHVVRQVLKTVIEPRIVKELDVNFTRDEIERAMLHRLKGNEYLAAKVYDVKDVDAYKSKTSVYYQISKRYGPGKHELIPNRAGVGVGSEKDTKRRKGLRRCTYEDFRKHKLSVADIDLGKCMEKLKPFYSHKCTVSEVV